MNANAPAVRSTSTLAIIALVAGILGWTVLPFLGSVMAIIFGHLGRAEIRRSPHLDGDGMALAGLVLGYSLVVISVLTAAFFVLVFGGLFAVFGLR